MTTPQKKVTAIQKAKIDFKGQPSLGAVLALMKLAAMTFREKQRAMLVDLRDEREFSALIPGQECWVVRLDDKIADLRAAMGELK